MSLAAGGDGASAGVGFDDGGGEALVHFALHLLGLREHLLHLAEVHFCFLTSRGGR
jgi:hypothetical protein